PTRWRSLLSRGLAGIVDVASALRSEATRARVHSPGARTPSRQNRTAGQAGGAGSMAMAPRCPARCGRRLRGRRLGSKVLCLEQRAQADVAARDHEHAMAPVVEGARVLGRGSHVRLHDVEHEKAVPGQVLDEPALKTGVALLDERRLDTRCRYWRQPKGFELVDAGAGAIADADGLLDEIQGWDVDGAFPAGLDQPEAVVFVPDVAADAGGREIHDRVPAHGHDVGLALP